MTEIDWNSLHMPEQLLEASVAEKLAGIFKKMGVDGVQIYTTLGREGQNVVKGLEKARSDVLVIVKASPRQYSSPTVPECQVPMQIMMSVKADADSTGAKNLALTAAIAKLLEIWQKCLDEAHEAFTVEGFRMAGFQMGGGSTSVDQATPAWEYTHEFTVYGITD